MEAGEADASVIAPLRDLESYLPGGRHPDWQLQSGEDGVGAVVAGDGNPRYGRISAYWQGALAAVESMMNVAAVGGTPRALTDCLNYGNPEIPEHLAALEEGVRGISDAARAITFQSECVPIISGNVSLYNSLPDGSSIPASAIVCCIGVIPDASKAVAMQMQESGSRLLLIGERKDECGGSAYYEVLEEMAGAERDALMGSTLPQPNFTDVAKQMQLVISAIGKGLVLSCHDISDGGLLLALFEMLCPQRKINHGLGASLDLATLRSPLSADRILFSQTPGFLIEIAPNSIKDIQKIAGGLGVSVTDIGCTDESGRMVIKNGDQSLVEEEHAILQRIWETALAARLDAR